MELTSPTVRLKFAIPLWRRLHSAWSWWLVELQAMLPMGLRRHILPPVQRVYFDLNGPILAMSYGSADSRRSLGSFPLAGSGALREPGPQVSAMIRRADDLVLCLPPDKVLTKSLTLPLAAEENLREVLGFEMDRNTPFSAQQVYYDYRVTARDPKQNTITLDLVLTPRPVLDELLAQLGELGFEPQRVSTRHKAGSDVLDVNLHPARGLNARSSTARYVNLALAAVAIALLVAAVGLPMLHKRQVIHSLEAELAATAEKAALARRLREDVDRLTRETQFLLQKKRSQPLALEVITELTRILPDDTWITNLDIKDWEVNLQGRSASAATLIPLVESSPVLSDARFRSPVIRMPGGDEERFHLSAEIARHASP